MRRLTQPHRLFEHRVEHRGEVAGRGIDDLQDLGGRGLPLQCLVALGAALVELPLEFRVDALQIGLRVVDRRGHVLTLSSRGPSLARLQCIPARGREQSFIR